ncbi:hypothetical protein, partial [Pseudomonas sp. KCJK8927]|uniref:hypothetical protein n=1 Tax=Pseudomonas sp. KCJK8927 TaxID=3344560 RepID=UPI003906B93F
FIEKNVHSEYHTYKKNRHNKDISYAHVDNVNIFKLIDDIYSQIRNNIIRHFEKFDDLSSWLRDQWAGLFADLLTTRKRDHDLEDLSSQVAGLKDLSSVLKSYTESIMSKLQPDNFEQIISSSNNVLKDRSIKHFKKNPLIDYCLSESPNHIDIVDLYDSFISSSTVLEFLQRCDYPESFVKDMSEHPEAEKDFQQLKLELG